MYEALEWGSLIEETRGQLRVANAGAWLAGSQGGRAMAKGEPVGLWFFQLPIWISERTGVMQLPIKLHR